MSFGNVIRPFRWDITRRSQLADDFVVRFGNPHGVPASGHVFLAGEHGKWVTAPDLRHMLGVLAGGLARVRVEGRSSERTLAQARSLILRRASAESSPDPGGAVSR